LEIDQAINLSQEKKRELKHEGRMFNFQQVQALYIEIYKFSENVNA
jgi:hypothetical protein